MTRSGEGTHLRTAVFCISGLIAAVTVIATLAISFAGSSIVQVCDVEGRVGGECRGYVCAGVGEGGKRRSKGRGRDKHSLATGMP